MKKRKLKREIRSALVIGVLLMGVIGVFSLFTVNFDFIGKKSIHSDAKKYQTSRCLAFYPDSKEGKNMAKQICKDKANGKENRIYDYNLIPYGDYYLVSYGGDYSFYSDKQYQPIKIETVDEDGLHIIADYVRYTVKKNNPKDYYNADFVKKTVYENMNFTGARYDIDGDSLKCRIPDYDFDIDVPLKYMQSHINMNFGYPNEEYKRAYYIDDEHPIICLTFDDGPQFWEKPGTTSSERIVNVLHEYDATATFFAVGDCLEERDAWTDYEVHSFLKKSISQGNEYASHTQDHAVYLTDMDKKEDIYKAINGPADFMKKNIGYEMKLYRPTGGFFSESVTDCQPLPAILWDIDSTDWDLRDADAIYNKMIDIIDRGILETGDVILFHDIYDETAAAIEKLVPEFVNRGFQLVTVSEMLDYIDIDESLIKYYYSPTYYE